MSKNQVNFKGRNDGIIIEVFKGDFSEIKKIIKGKLDGNRNFYKGAKIIGIESDILSLKEKLDILYFLKYRYRLNIEEDIIDELLKPKKELKVKENKNEIITKFIHRTIRSGQSEEYDGNLVIIGDVNPGAIVKATGSIIVLGAFRGVGFAGINGDTDAIVASYKMAPTQIRIADKIGRSSNGKEGKDLNLPEIAKIEGDRLVIEPYLPNK